MTPIEGTVKVSGGVIVREFHIPAGSDLVTHSHPYDHFSFLLSGEATLTTDGVPTLLIAPRMVEIKANTHHGIHAKTDCVWDCLHSLFLADRAADKGDPYVMAGIEERN